MGEETVPDEIWLIKINSTERRQIPSAALTPLLSVIKPCSSDARQP
jgi:hypothetical protein